MQGLLHVQMKLIYLILILISSYSVFALFILWGRDEYSKKQKVIQSFLVVFLPIIGAILIHGMVREFDRVPKSRGPNNGLGGDSMPGGTQ